MGCWEIKVHHPHRIGLRFQSSSHVCNAHRRLLHHRTGKHTLYPFPLLDADTPLLHTVFTIAAAAAYRPSRPPCSLHIHPDTLL
jgi:hypothetical protein